MVWTDTPALRGGGFELLLDCNWIKKGWRVAIVWPLGCWGEFVPVLSSACVCRERLVLFLLPEISSPGEIAQERKMAAMFNKIVGLLGKWCHTSKRGWLCPFGGYCLFHRVILRIKLGFCM